MMATVALPIVAPLLTAQPLASVRFIVHGLTVTPPHRSAAGAHVGDPLFAAYGLGTRAGERASIRFSDKTTLHINQRTSLVLRSTNVTFVSKGEVDVNDQPGSHHRIVTGTAIATAIGTRYDVRIERKASNSA
jgi:ferric-dicitrate binding protein FerR (iron transport regulator)